MYSDCWATAGEGDYCPDCIRSRAGGGSGLGAADKATARTVLAGNIVAGLVCARRTLVAGRLERARSAA